MSLGLLIFAILGYSFFGLILLRQILVIKTKKYQLLNLPCFRGDADKGLTKGVVIWTPMFYIGAICSIFGANHLSFSRHDLPAIIHLLFVYQPSLGLWLAMMTATAILMFIRNKRGLWPIKP